MDMLDPNVINLTSPSTATFWLETVTTGQITRDPKHKRRLFVPDPPPETIMRIGYWIDTLVAHDQEFIFSFDNPSGKGHLVVVFNGDSPFVGEDEKPIYAFELRDKPVRMRTRKERDEGGFRDRRCTTRMGGAKYTVAYIGDNGVGQCRSLDPEVIIVH